MSENVSPRVRALVRAMEIDLPGLKTVNVKDSANLPRNNNLILDPSVFAYSKAFSSVLESEFVEKYRVLIPTLIYESIRSEDYGRFVEAAGSWEGRKREELEKVWKELIEQAEQMQKVSVPISRVFEELDPEQRSVLKRMDEVLSISEWRFRPRDMVSMGMAVEIIRIGCVTSVILSVSGKAKKWYGKLRGTVIQKAESNQTLMEVKHAYRNAMRKSGWKGNIIIWIARLTPLPISPAAGIGVNVTIDLVLIVLADGTHRCQICGRSLWRLLEDAKFCPYCSNPLAP